MNNLKFLLIMMSCCFCTCVIASDLFQSTNPFPQTMPETMNNIYESTPSAIQKDRNKTKKDNIKIKNNYAIDELQSSQLQVFPKIKSNEDNSFYKF